MKQITKWSPTHPPQMHLASQLELRGHSADKLARHTETRVWCARVFTRPALPMGSAHTTTQSTARVMSANSPCGHTRCRLVPRTPTSSTSRFVSHPISRGGACACERGLAPFLSCGRDQKWCVRPHSGRRNAKKRCVAPRFLFS